MSARLLIFDLYNYRNASHCDTLTKTPLRRLYTTAARMMRVPPPSQNLYQTGSCIRTSFYCQVTFGIMNYQMPIRLL